MSLELVGVSISVLGRSLIRPFDLVIEAGDIVTLMGGSGSGKSSLLAYLAGDLPKALQGSGTVTLDKRNVLDQPPEQRRIGRLFQDDLLFPHMSVIDNLLFGMARGERHDRKAKAHEALQKAGLGQMANRMPHTLSGGQRSRAALLRALLAEPLAILLDEPFAKLDTELRETVRAYVFNGIKSRNIPALMVTHDISDAPKGGRVFRINRDGEVQHV